VVCFSANRNDSCVFDLDHRLFPAKKYIRLTRELPAESFDLHVYLLKRPVGKQLRHFLPPCQTFSKAKAIASWTLRLDAAFIADSASNVIVRRFRDDRGPATPGAAATAERMSHGKS
jgi:hypothetical protein